MKISILPLVFLLNILSSVGQDTRIQKKDFRMRENEFREFYPVKENTLPKANLASIGQNINGALHNANSDNSILGGGKNGELSYNLSNTPTDQPKIPSIKFEPIYVTTFAGINSAGFKDGNKAEALFNGPNDVATDFSGNIYVADYGNHRIRKISQAGNVTTLAGNGLPGFADGPGVNAQFNHPYGIDVDENGNVYVADHGNNRIRKLTPEGFVTTIAGDGTSGYLDGDAASARFVGPYDVAVDKNGNVYVADHGNNRIRKISVNGTVSTFAGNGMIDRIIDGIGTEAQFYNPEKMNFNSEGDLYVTESYGPMRKITPAALVTSIMISADPSLGQGFQGGLVIDLSNNIYVATELQGDRNFIVKHTPAGNDIVVAGSTRGYQDGIGADAKFYFAAGLALDLSGNLLVADFGSNRIRRITAPPLFFSSQVGSPSSPDSFAVSGNDLAGNLLIGAPIGFEISLSETGVYSTNISISPASNEVNSLKVFVRLAAGNSGGIYTGNIGLFTQGANLKFLPVKGTIFSPIVQFDPIKVSTLAGNGQKGFADGPASLSSFNFPTGAAMDLEGNFYVADEYNHRIRKITPYGQVSTFAGTGVAGFADGEGINAQFSSPYSVAVDGRGNVYVTDAGNNRIRKISQDGMVTTLAGSGETGFEDGLGAQAKFFRPMGIAVDRISQSFYVADNGNNCIRKISSTGEVTTLAGNSLPGTTDGIGINSQFYSPNNVAVDPSGNIYVTEYYGPLRKITPGGLVSTIHTPGNAFDLFQTGVVVDNLNSIYVTVQLGSGKNAIYKIAKNGSGTQVAGSTIGYLDGNGTATKFWDPTGLAYDHIVGNVVVADMGNHRIRKIMKPELVFCSPVGVTTVPQYFYISGSNLTSNVVVTAPNGYEISLAEGDLFTTEMVISPGAGEVGSTRIYIRLKNGIPHGSYNGNITLQSNGFATQYLPVTGNVLTPALIFDQTIVSTVAGNGIKGFADGSSLEASFNEPTAIAGDIEGNIYVADRGNHRIRKISTAGVVTTLAGTGVAGYADGIGSTAQFYSPRGIVVDATGNVYVSDENNHRIRKITPAGMVSTVAGNGNAGFMDGTGLAAQFNSPDGLALDSTGNLYVADFRNHRIRKISSTGLVSTFAGSGIAGVLDGIGTAAQFSLPRGLAFDSYNYLYVTDVYGALRKISKLAEVSTILSSGTGLSGFPDGVAVDNLSSIFVSSTYSQDQNHIFKISQSGEYLSITSIELGYKDGIVAESKFAYPAGLFAEKTGAIFVADLGNNRIRKISAPIISLNAIAGTPSEAMSFNISGVNLTADATITAPAGFEISKTLESGYNTTLIIQANSGKIAGESFYIRLKGTIGAGSYNGFVLLTSVGAINQQLLVKGLVTDNVPPIIQCPPSQILCFNSTATYSLPEITASDISGIRSIKYAIAGATNRNGSGPNASGAFNPGQSVITWLVTDSAGNSSTCQTSIRIDYPLAVSIPNTYPLLIWGEVNTIYKGFGPGCAFLIAVPDGGTRLPGNRYRYQWSNGSISQFINVCPATAGLHLYTVTITDSLGCQATATKAIYVKDVRCGPNLDKVLICRPAWPGNGEACVSKSQAVVLALLFGARLGGCDHLLTTPGAQKATESVSIFENRNRNISVSPNPNTGSFTVQINNLNAAEIRVIDQNGKIIYRKWINETVKSQTVNINLGNLAKGMYIIQALSKEGVQSCKMMIQ